MRQSGDKPKLLMIDDDPDFQAIVRGWTSSSYDHIGLGSGEGIIEVLSEIEPDIVILDVSLPDYDGFSLCKTIRADPRFSELPIIFLTGRTEDEDFLKHLDVAGTAYLTKPVARKRLLSALRENLAVWPQAR